MPPFLYYRQKGEGQRDGWGGGGESKGCFIKEVRGDRRREGLSGFEVVLFSQMRSQHGIINKDTQDLHRHAHTCL